MIISTGQRATFGLTPALSRQRERGMTEFLRPKRDSRVALRHKGLPRK